MPFKKGDPRAAAATQKGMHILWSVKNPIEKRFWERVNKTSGCWEWTGGKRKYGYGTLRHNGKQYQAHRFSYLMAYGECPDHLNVCHRCDNPSCVRPDHLFLGTDQDNATDKANKGRSHRPRGERNPKAKLSEDDVRNIRVLAAKPGVTRTSLAKQYGVNVTTISSIALGKTWREV